MRVESEVKESISLDESSSSTTASSSGSTTNNNNTDADVSKPKGTVEKQVVAGSTTLIVKEEKEEDDDDNNSNNLFSITDFHNNDNKILAVLNEAGSNYSFKGLMRKLNLHQQSLSRALHRLEEMGIVEKSPAGYRLASARTTSSSTTTAGAGALVIAKEELQRPKGREYTQLLQTYIPVSVRASEIVRLLIGKWFKNLRWLGMIERSGTGYTLQWASEDGSFHINVRMISDYIIIETNASTEREKMQAMIGSYAIYEQITKAVQSRLGTYSLDQSHHISTRNN